MQPNSVDPTTIANEHAATHRAIENRHGKPAADWNLNAYFNLSKKGTAFRRDLLESM